MRDLERMHEAATDSTRCLGAQEAANGRAGWHHLPAQGRPMGLMAVAARHGAVLVVALSLISGAGRLKPGHVRFLTLRAKPRPNAPLASFAWKGMCWWSTEATMSS